MMDCRRYFVLLSNIKGDCSNLSSAQDKKQLIRIVVDHRSHCSVVFESRAIAVILISNIGSEIINEEQNILLFIIPRAVFKLLVLSDQESKTKPKISSDI